MQPQLHNQDACAKYSVQAHGHRKPDHGPWLWMSKAAMERAVSAGGYTGLAIYAGLCRLESDTPPKAKGGFHASANNIAHASGAQSRTVQKYLPLLSKAGLILMKSGRNKGPSGSHEANVYRLLDVGPPCDTQSQAYECEIEDICAQKRKFSRREKEISSERKKNGGSAAGSSAGADAGASSPRKIAPTSVTSGDAFKNG